MPKLNKLIDRHIAYYKRSEKSMFDKARRFYRGDFFALSDSGMTDGARNFLCSKNMIYAIADTAVSALLGPHPSVAAVGRTPNSQDAAVDVTGLMDYVLETNRFRRKASTALIDAVLCKRGIFKTGWDDKRDIPIIRAVNPSQVFFDLTVRDTDDIRYWLEATVISYEEFKRRIDSGQYDKSKLQDVNPDRYPKWLLDPNQQSSTNSLRDAFEWITIWEYYDREKGIMQHYVKQADAVVFEQKIDYIPYSMFTLNQSGVDCLGLSEVQLVLNQQETINDLLTHMKHITYLMIPRILFDSGRITEEDLNKAVEASAGSFVGVAPQNSEALRSLASLFYEMPMPDNPMGVKEFIARQEDDAAFISALAEAARGQVTGARTATEMAIIDAQMRETMLQVLPFLMENPNINVRELTEEVVNGLGLPQRIVLPEEDVMAAQQQEALMMQQASLGGAAAGGPAMMAAMGAEGGEAPIGEAEISPEEAFAAGGGSPIREGAPEA